MKDLRVMENKDLAPVVLFVHNRPLHTTQTIESLVRNKLAEQSELYVFSDAPKSEADRNEVMEVRNYIRQIKGFRKVHLVERKENMGLARSIIEGVSSVLEKHGKVIVMEDDLISSPHFLTFMNEALAIYEEEKRVMHISGFTYSDEKMHLPNLFLWNVASTWGWGTWADRWEHLSLDAAYLFREIRKRKKLREFDLNSYGFFTDQLTRNISGKITTWGIKWQASIFLQNGLCLNPGKTLIKNIGFDEKGTHTKYRNKTLEGQRLDMDYPVKVEKIPIRLSYEVTRKMKNYYWARCYQDFWLGSYLKAKSFFKFYLKKLLPAD